MSNEQNLKCAKHPEGNLVRALDDNQEPYWHCNECQGEPVATTTSNVRSEAKSGGSQSAAIKTATEPAEEEIEIEGSEVPNEPEDESEQVESTELVETKSDPVEVAKANAQLERPESLTGKQVTQIIKSLPLAIAVVGKKSAAMTPQIISMKILPILRVGLNFDQFMLFAGGEQVSVFVLRSGLVALARLYIKGYSSYGVRPATDEERDQLLIEKDSKDIAVAVQLYIDRPYKEVTEYPDGRKTTKEGTETIELPGIGLGKATPGLKKQGKKGMYLSAEGQYPRELAETRAMRELFKRHFGNKPMPKQLEVVLGENDEVN